MKFAKPVKSRKKRKEKIAIIGSGPAGLCAAGHLICEGYQVYIYEKLPEPGGLLIFGIPDFRMPKDKIIEGIEELKTLGVKFLCGIEVGRDIDFEDIVSKYNAVLIATGAWIGKLPKIPGINLKGVYTAIHYLTELQLYKKGYAEKKPEIGKVVAVIGGGDT
ncbi:MAG: glutamate synthase, partial [Thermoprotei archaeon]